MFAVPPLLAQGTVRVSKSGDGGGSVVSVPSGIDCGGRCAAFFAGPMTLFANPDGNSLFTGWSGDCAGAGCALWVDGNKNVTANFAAKRTLTTIISGPGGIASLPLGIACLSGSCAAQFNPGSRVVLTAAASPGAVWLGYSGGGCGLAQICTVTLSSSVTVTARFATPTLSVSFRGDGDGSVFSDPSGITCSKGSNSNCSFTFPPGTNVTLRATPNGSTFDGWGSACNGRSLTCAVTMNNSRSVTARVSKGTIAFQVSHVPPITASFVSMNDQTVCSANCTERVLGGTPVRLTAVVNDDRGVFLGWNVNGVTAPQCSGNSLSCNFTFPPDASPVSVSARFGQPTITLQRTGLGRGTLSFAESPVAGPLVCSTGCPVSRSYSAGTMIHVKIVADAGSALRAVTSGAACSGSGCTFPLTFSTVVNADFGRLFAVTITPNSGGRVDGLVANESCSEANPAGCNAKLLDGTTIVLTATPGAGFRRGNWGGACATADPASTCKLTVVDRNLQASYSFIK